MLASEPNHDPAEEQANHDSFVDYLEEHFRQSAAQSLGSFGDEARPAVQSLAALLTAPKPIVRAAATNALRAINPGALPAAHLTDPARSLRASAVNYLLFIGRLPSSWTSRLS
jgi:HEAT repeat protein